MPISTPAVRVRRDRFGQLLTSETEEPRSIDKDNQMLGVDKDNQMLRVDKDNQMLVVDDENGDPGAYLEYPRDSDTSN